MNPRADTLLKMAHEAQPKNTLRRYFLSISPDRGIALLGGILLHEPSERASISDLHSYKKL